MNYANLRLVGIVGVPILVICLYNSYRGLQAEKWKRTSGEVILSEKVSGFSRKSLDLKVDYFVNDVNYTCTQVEFGQKPHWRDSYRYFKGAQVRVFYNPNQPSDCILEPGLSQSMGVGIMVGFGLLLLSLYGHRKLKYGDRTPTPHPMSDINHDPNEQINLERAHEYARQDRLIEAIKIYREVTGAGLKEAKEYIEKYQRENS